MFFTVPFTVFLFNGLIGACDVMVAMLVDRNNKIFFLWELTSIFMQTI